MIQAMYAANFVTIFAMVYHLNNFLSDSDVKK